MRRRTPRSRPGPDEFVVQPVVTQDVADVLTEEALDALTKLLHAFDVVLVDAPAPVWRIRLAWGELLDAFLDLVVP